MTVDMSARNDSPEYVSGQGPERHLGHTIVVKTASSSIDSAASSDRSSPNEEIQTATSHTPSSTYPAPNETDSPHKRKRSDEDGQISPARRYDYTPPQRTEQPRHMADRALHALDSNQPQPYYSNITTTGHWNRDQHSQPPSANSAHPTSANSGQDQSWDVSASQNAQTYDQDGNGIVRKRKRNFANRTKSGCGTCRRRKKKCDEGRPNCANCVRGGFSCAGYNIAVTSGVWTPVSKQPVPLQAKDGQTEEQPPRPQHQSPDGYVTYNNGPTRSMQNDEHERPQPYATTSVSEPRHNSRPPYPGQAWPPQQGQAASYNTKDTLAPVTEAGHSSHPPSREMSRPPTQAGTPAPPTTYPLPVSQPSQYPTPAPQPHPPAPQPYYAPQPEYRPSYPPPSDQSYRSSSRLPSAGYDTKRGASKSFFSEDVERSKMIRKVPYDRLDATLVDDRKRCRRALARYHAACEVDSGMDDEQARRMLEKVFDPSRDESHNFRSRPDRRGVLSHKVRIEPGFHCTYGYNLKMMESVYIAENTTIDDSNTVEIGPRTTIGANVKIITSEPCKDLIDRKGSQGSWIAKEVFIGSGVVIGDNVIIYPDVRLENGVTVEAGAIVKESAPENAVLRAPAAYRPSQQPYPQGV